MKISKLIFLTSLNSEPPKPEEPSKIIIKMCGIRDESSTNQITLYFQSLKNTSIHFNFGEGATVYVSGKQTVDFDVACNGKEQAIKFYYSNLKNEQIYDMTITGSGVRFLSYLKFYKYDGNNYKGDIADLNIANWTNVSLLKEIRFKEIGFSRKTTISDLRAIPNLKNLVVAGNGIDLFVDKDNSNFDLISIDTPGHIKNVKTKALGVGGQDVKMIIEDCEALSGSFHCNFIDFNNINNITSAYFTSYTRYQDNEWNLSGLVNVEELGLNPGRDSALKFTPCDYSKIKSFSFGEWNVFPYIPSPDQAPELNSFKASIWGNGEVETPLDLSNYSKLKNIELDTQKGILPFICDGNISVESIMHKMDYETDYGYRRNKGLIRINNNPMLKTIYFHTFADKVEILNNQNLEIINAPYLDTKNPINIIDCVNLKKISLLDSFGTNINIQNVESKDFTIILHSDYYDYNSGLKTIDLNNVKHITTFECRSQSNLTKIEIHGCFSDAPNFYITNCAAISTVNISNCAFNTQTLDEIIHDILNYGCKNVLFDNRFNLGEYKVSDEMRTRAVTQYGWTILE